MAQADLTTLLQELNPRNPYQDRIMSLGMVMKWIRLPVKTQNQTGTAEHIHSRDVRFKFLMQYLERNTPEAKNLADTLKEMIVPGGTVGLYCLTGISGNLGFLNELSNRIIQKILPDSYTEKDFSTIFKVLFIEEEDAHWLEHSAETIIPSFMEFLARHEINFATLASDLHEARVILGAQVATLGTAPDIRRRVKGQRLIDSSFLRLNAVINRESGDSGQNILVEINQSRTDLMTVRKKLEDTGVSVDLIFRIEKISAILERIEMLIDLEFRNKIENRSQFLGQMIGRLIRDEIKSLGVKTYIRENLHFLTRKIVERAGDRGQHYIATTSSEKKDLFKAAAWAGVLTAFTALIKYMIGVASFPLFFEGFFFFINYAAGFLMMQQWHLALSSKQPAYTASSLAKKLEEFKITKKLDNVSSEIKKIMYSQGLTTVGNLLLVIPIVVLLDSLWNYSVGHHFMSQEEALKTISKHNIFTSLTIPFAILTGIFLWLSSVIAGWIENWIVFREIPEALRSNRVLKNIFGDQIETIASHFAVTVGGIAGNLAIAAFLGFPIILGKFIAIPLDIRHVTLAAGTISFALNALEWDLQLYWPVILNMFLSIIVIGFFNFSVSFYLALRMAALAQDVESKYLKIIFKYSFKKKPTQN